MSGDGVPDILIGAEGVTVDGNAYQGQAYLFSGADGSLLHVFDHPNPQAGAAFGITAASVGDVDGDGLSDLLMAAACQTVGGNACQGQAYLYLSGATPEDLLTNLVESVIDMNVEQNISGSLDAKVDAALAAVQDVNENNDEAAIRSLQAFINSVEAQRGGKLTDEQADELIAAAQQIIDLIGG